MTTRTVFPLLLCCLFVACGGSAPPAEAPPTEPSKEKSDMPAEPAAEQPADDGAKPGASPPEAKKKDEPAPKLDKPKSASTIAGKSLSEVEGTATFDAAKKLGWAKDGGAVGGGTIGSYEQLRFDIEKGKLKGFVELVRPAANPTPASSGSMTPPVELKAMREKEGAAVHLDDAADVIVIVAIEGKTADAKKLLGQLVKIAKAAPAAKAQAAKPPK